MLRLKQIFKTILKYKTSTVLTLLSLVISFVGIIFLTLYVSFEKSFDRFHDNAPSIYRLETRMEGSAVPAIEKDVIQQNIPEVEKITPFSFGSAKISTSKLSETNVRFESSMLYSDNSFFDIFTFPFTLGNPASALTEPYTVVLTESLCSRLFGKANPLGETVLIDDEGFKVSAVIKDFPKNSSFQADCIPSFATHLKKDPEVSSWGNWSFNIFMKLRPGSNPALVADKIEKGQELAQFLEGIKSRYPNQPMVSLRPLTEIHFVEDVSYHSANKTILNVLALLTVILMIMGAVNFINFSTSQAPSRVKALSILQVLGGKRLSSMGQIIAESVMLSFAALVVSLGVHSICYASIESLFDITGMGFAGRYHFIAYFFLFAVGFGILAGLYPASFITSLPITQAMKGSPRFAGKGKVFRNTLLTVQFVFSIALITSALVIEKQLCFWRNYDIGIDKEHVVYLNTTAELQNHYQAFADELMKNRDITDYTYSQFIPGEVYSEANVPTVDGQHIKFKSWPVDERFLDFFGIKIITGRKFSKESKADLNKYVMNEKAVQQFGWSDSFEKMTQYRDTRGRVIGIAKNFNFSSLKEGIEPLAFRLSDALKNELLLRIKPGNYARTLAYITETARKFDPKNHVEARFLDDALNNLYNKEEKMGRLVEFVALWCILLSIAGLLGLVIFICQDRVKEIGIRKVNGARISEIMVMLGNDYIKLVAVAFIIATPLAWYAVHKWLESFAYKIPLYWWIFALSGFIALGIALLTVSWQSWKAATRNPVEALRYE